MDFPAAHLTCAVRLTGYSCVDVNAVLTMTRNASSFLLHHQSFSKGRLKIAITERDIAGLKALRSLGGRISTPAELAAALEPSSTASQNALAGGRLIRRLENFEFVQELAAPDSGYQLTAAGQRAAGDTAG